MMTRFHAMMMALTCSCTLGAAATATLIVYARYGRWDKALIVIAFIAGLLTIVGAARTDYS